MKKIIFYQSWFNTIGGVETMAYNWCWWMRNYYDITVLYSGGDKERLRKMGNLVKTEHLDEKKTYECDIFIRNSVWGVVPKNIEAKRSIEMRHANYKYLLEIGHLYDQYKDMGIQEIVGCGEFVSKMSNEVLHDNPKTIKNILLPRRETGKVIKLISCTRLDSAKGWNRMLKMMHMMKSAGIKFEWNIFTNSKQICPYEEAHFWKQRYDIWDYLTDADYTVLLSDSEGLPYTVQESLQYQVPCIVTDIGGCTELVKDGVNGYVVPLDMEFDINRIRNIPKCPEYENHSLEDWLEYLEYDGEKIDKEMLIRKFKEEKEMKARVKCVMRNGYYDVELDRKVQEGEELILELERAEYLEEKGGVTIIERISEEKRTEPATEPATEAPEEKIDTIIYPVEPKTPRETFKKKKNKKK